jgi:hypothetical protein
MFVRSLIQAPDRSARLETGIEPFTDDAFQTELTHRLENLSGWRLKQW